jgi:HlyD family secretion protein/epimerase transport system membrane fusion protein
MTVAFGIAFGGFSCWIPLAGGAVAPGIISPEGDRRTVQHLEGGIVAAIEVRDGQYIEAGQPLLALENAQEQATHDALLEQRWALWARQSRLNAERRGLERLDLPPELRRPDRRIVAVVAAQEQVFATRRLAHATKKSVLRQKIEQLAEQIKGVQAQVQSATRQLTLIAEEMRAKDMLVDKGLVAKPEALRLKRVDAEITGKRGEYLAEIARLRQQIAETEMQLLVEDAEWDAHVASEADKVGQELSAVGERIRASDDILRRTIVTAPVSGTIISLKFKTVGGVVHAGEAILQIVPAEGVLIVEARVTPIDVKSVRKGLAAQIHFSAYSSRSTPRVPGVVQSVSADRLLDPHTHEPYYLARVAVDKKMLQQLAPHVEMIPGMPVDVLIVTDHRSLIEYLMKPFWDTFRRSFHEL